MSFDVEKGVISKLLQERDISAIRDYQLKASHFEGENKNAFLFIEETIKATGEIPTPRAFSRQFPNYKLETCVVDGKEVVGTEENMKFWNIELRRKVTHNILVRTVGEVTKDLTDLQSEKALELLKSKITYIESEVTENEDRDITKGTDLRKQKYLERKMNKGMLGLSTGIKHLDYLTKGLEDATLTTCIAKTGVGKTWLQVLIGAYSMINNCRVLQLVTEMSDDLMLDRYEAVLYAKCYGAFNYGQFKSGTLSPSVEENYFKFLEEDLPTFEPLIIATATGVISVGALIEKYDPDLILIDSAYLMEDDQGAKDDWLRVAHITRDLKKLAKRLKKPIVINTQADKNTSRKAGPELDSIMYTQAIGQDSDIVLAMYRDEVMLNDHEMGLKILKQREGTLGKVMLNWDFNTMNFSEIYMESADSRDRKSVV